VFSSGWLSKPHLAVEPALRADSSIRVQRGAEIGHVTFIGICRCTRAAIVERLETHNERKIMSVSPEYLLKGAAYALEQCGLLLRDANILYRKCSYASTVVLTAFAQEEFGRSEILLDLRKRALAEEVFTIDQIKTACNDHVTKQRAGMASLTMRADKESGLGKILQASQNPPQSAEWQKADAALKQIDETKTKRTPSDRDNLRMAALYVEPVSESGWNRPANISALKAYESLVQATNDYSIRYQQRYPTPKSMLKDLDPELYGAFEQWPDRPELQPPEHPRYPG
jgi:AbiV family abortive infection protein